MTKPCAPTADRSPRPTLQASSNAEADGKRGRRHHRSLGGERLQQRAVRAVVVLGDDVPEVPDRLMVVQDQAQAKSRRHAFDR